jgi:hypothetical protein
MPNAIQRPVGACVTVRLCLPSHFEEERQCRATCSET